MADPAAGPGSRGSRIRSCRHSLAVLLLLPVLAILPGCLNPATVVMRFRQPSTAESWIPALPVRRGSPRVTPYLAAELEGVQADRIRDTILGTPHEVRDAPGTAEIWLYTFVRMPAGYRLHHDARLIGRFPGDYPNLRLALVLSDTTVVNAQIAWFEQTPALAFDVERLLGRPDRRETTEQGERFHYRYECFTQTERRSGAVKYVLTDAVLTVEFSAEGNTSGADLLLADQTKITIFPDGRTEDPSTGKSWQMRPNLAAGAGGATTAAQTPVDLITTGVEGLNSVGRVQATFGWPTETLRGTRGGLPLTFAIYPIQRERSVPGHLVVTYLQDEERTTVKSLGIHWKGGMPSDPADLRQRLGSPDRTTGTPAGGRELWIYEYRLAAPPPVTGTRQRLELGLRVTFQIRNSIELLPTVDVERTSRLADSPFGRRN